MEHSEISSVVERTAKNHGGLIAILEGIQAKYGYLPREALEEVAAKTGRSLVDIYGVATFYHMFTFEPLGEHNCIVCTGTACHVKGSDRIVQVVGDAFHIKDGETTPDGLFSLTTARCLGSCGLAPVVVLDGKVSAKETAESTMRKVQDIVALTKEEIAELGIRD